MNVLIHDEAVRDVEKLPVKDREYLLKKMEFLSWSPSSDDWLRHRTVVMDIGGVKMYLSRIQKTRLLWSYFPKNNDGDRNMLILGVYRKNESSGHESEALATKAVSRLKEFFEQQGLGVDDP